MPIRYKRKVGSGTRVSLLYTKEEIDDLIFSVPDKLMLEYPVAEIQDKQKEIEDDLDNYDQLIEDLENNLDDLNNNKLPELEEALHGEGGLYDRLGELDEALNDPDEGLYVKLGELDDALNDPDEGLYAKLDILDDALNDPNEGLYAKLDILDGKQDELNDEIYGEDGLLDRLGTLNDALHDPNDGLYAKLDVLEGKSDQLDQLITGEDGLESRLQELDDALNNEETGLVAKLDDLETKQGELDLVINDPEDGLVTRLGTLNDALYDETTGLVSKLGDLETQTGTLHDFIHDENTGLDARLGLLDDQLNLPGGLVSKLGDLETHTGELHDAIHDETTGLNVRLGQLDDQLNLPGGLVSKLGNLETQTGTLHDFIHDETTGLDARLGLLDDQLNLPGGLVSKLGNLETQTGTLHDTIHGDGGLVSQIDTLDDLLGDVDSGLNSRLDNLNTILGNPDSHTDFFESIAANEAFIGTFVANEGYVGQLVAQEGFINTLTTNEAFIQKLTAQEAFIENLTASTVWTTELIAGSAFVDTITSDTIFTNELITNRINVETIAAETSFINTLVGQEAFINTLTGDTAFISAITAETIFTSELLANRVDIGLLVARDGFIENLTTSNLWTTELTAENAFVSAITAETILTNELLANRIDVEKLVARDGFIQNLTTSNLWTTELTAENAFVSAITADTILTDSLLANRIDVGLLVARDGFIEHLTTTNLWTTELTAENTFVSAITSETILTDKLIANRIDVEELVARDGFIEHLTTTNLWTTELTTENAFVSAITADTILTAELIANRIDVEKLVAREGFIEHLTATNLWATELTAESAFIEHLTADTILTDELITNRINVDKLVADTALVDTLVGDSAFINKITADTIFTDELITNRINVKTLVGEKALVAEIISDDVWTNQIVANDAFIDSLLANNATLSGSIGIGGTIRIGPNVSVPPINQYGSDFTPSNLSVSYTISTPRTEYASTTTVSTEKTNITVAVFYDFEVPYWETRVIDSAVVELVGDIGTNSEKVISSNVYSPNDSNINILDEYLIGNTFTFNTLSLRLKVVKPSGFVGPPNPYIVTVSDITIRQQSSSIGLTSDGLYQRLDENRIIPYGTGGSGGAIVGGGGGLVGWNDILDKPTTFTPSSHSHGYSDLPMSQTQANNWDTAYGWGDHASVGYLAPTGNQSFAGQKTFTNRLRIENTSYENHLELNRSNLTYRLSPSTGNNSGSSNELRFESPSNHSRYWFDGVVSASHFNIDSATVINSDRDIFARDGEFRNVKDGTTHLGQTYNLSRNYTRDAIGEDGTPEDWANLPIGTRLFGVGTDFGQGAPTNVGFFEKFANRDTSGGWAGLWLPYNNANRFYVGYAANSTEYATWQQVALHETNVDFTSIAVGGATTIDSNRDYTGGSGSFSGLVRVHNSSAWNHFALTRGSDRWDISVSNTGGLMFSPQNGSEYGSEARVDLSPSARYFGTATASGDQYYDIGTPNTRWRDLHLGRDANIGGRLRVFGRQNIIGPSIPSDWNTTSDLTIQGTHRVSGTIIEVFNSDEESVFSLNGAGYLHLRNLDVANVAYAERLTTKGRHSDSSAIEIHHPHTRDAGGVEDGLSVADTPIQDIVWRYEHSGFNTTFAKISTVNYNTGGTGWYARDDRISAGIDFYVTHLNELTRALRLTDRGNAHFGDLLHINTVDTRFEVHDQTSEPEKIAMGYLGGLPVNNYDPAVHHSTHWGSNDYGFWVKNGDKMIIDGDVNYENGDWLIENDATLMIVDGQTENRIIALGTDAGRKGLFLYDNLEDIQVELTLAGLKAVNGFDFQAGSDFWRTSDNQFQFGGTNGIYSQNGQAIIGTDTKIYGDLDVNILPAVSDEGLVGLWRFDGSAMDYSGNGNDGTIVGNPQFVPGVSGQALEFDGDDSISATMGGTLLSDEVNFSASVWFQVTGLPENGNVVGIIGRSTSGRWGIDYYFEGDSLRFGVRGSSQITIGTTFGSGDHNQWHHAVLVHESTGSGTGIVKAYLNGVYVGQRVYSDAWTTDNEVYIASNNAGLGGGPVDFIGLIDEPRIYNRALTPREIKSLYLNPSGNSGGLISANQVRTGTIESNNGNLSFDLDSGLLEAENFDIIAGTDYWKTSGNRPFRFGDGILKGDNNSVELAGWNANSSRLWNDNIELHSTGGIGHTSNKWRLNNDGSGRLADGAILWDENGVTTIGADVNILATLSASNITTGTLDASKITVTNLSADSINSGTISADMISGGTINGNNVNVTNLNASNITSGTINSSRINVNDLMSQNIDFSGVLRSSNNRVVIRGDTTHVGNFLDTLTQAITILRDPDGYPQFHLVRNSRRNRISLFSDANDWGLLMVVDNSGEFALNEHGLSLRAGNNPNFLNAITWRDNVTSSSNVRGRLSLTGSGTSSKLIVNSAYYTEIYGGLELRLTTGGNAPIVINAGTTRPLIINGLMTSSSSTSNRVWRDSQGYLRIS